MYTEHKYEFHTLDDVDKYWYEMWNFCIHTQLGMLVWRNIFVILHWIVVVDVADILDIFCCLRLENPWLLANACVSIFKQKGDGENLLWWEEE